jgi:hypothetical protein
LLRMRSAISRWQPRRHGSFKINCFPQEPMSITYTGSEDNICPITHKLFPEIEIPVVFQWNPAQPCECAALIQWLRVCSRDPMTNRDCAVDMIAPLWQETVRGRLPKCR